jgi:hypothetical protein
MLLVRSMTAGVSAAPDDFPVNDSGLRRACDSPSEIAGGPFDAGAPLDEPCALFRRSRTQTAGRVGEPDPPPARHRCGMSGGISIFPKNRFGLQWLVERATCDVAAASCCGTVKRLLAQANGALCFAADRPDVTDEGAPDLRGLLPRHPI